jgi:hypothetical protein
MDPEKLLENLGLMQYLPQFRAAGITSSLLPVLTDTALKQLGISLLGHRKRILLAIQAQFGPTYLLNGVTSTTSSTSSFIGTNQSPPRPRLKAAPVDSGAHSYYRIDQAWLQRIRRAADRGEVCRWSSQEVGPKGRRHLTSGFTVINEEALTKTVCPRAKTFKTLIALLHHAGFKKESGFWFLEDNTGTPLFTSSSPKGASSILSSPMENSLPLTTTIQQEQIISQQTGSVVLSNNNNNNNSINNNNNNIINPVNIINNNHLFPHNSNNNITNNYIPINTMFLSPPPPPQQPQTLQQIQQQQTLFQPLPTVTSFSISSVPYAPVGTYMKQPQSGDEPTILIYPSQQQQLFNSLMSNNNNNNNNQPQPLPQQEQQQQQFIPNTQQQYLYTPNTSPTNTIPSNNNTPTNNNNRSNGNY